MIQFRIVLLQLRPNFWWRVVVPNCRLADLPLVVTRVFEGPHRDETVASGNWQCRIQGLWSNRADRLDEISQSESWNLDLRTALRLDGNAKVGKFRMVYKQWTFLLVLEKTADVGPRTAACVGGWGRPVSLGWPLDLVNAQHRQFVTDSLRRKTDKISRKIFMLKRELSAKGRGSRLWEERWCRMRGEDDWADELCERREKKEATLSRLSRQQSHLERELAFEHDRKIVRFEGGTECEIVKVPYHFDLS